MHGGFFAKPPEIHRAGDKYVLHVHPLRESPVILAFAPVKESGDDLHVFLSGATSGARPSPWVYDLNIPKRFRGRNLTHRFFWRNPDKSVHPLPVISDDHSATSADAR
jgi:hypothetical protein